MDRYSVCKYLCFFLWLLEYLFPQLLLLQWQNVAWCVGIPASIIGVAYVLSIKNPQNYTGFYAGILMSLLLGVQFYLQGQYDSTFLYLLVFIPLQIRSILTWKSHEVSADLPAFLSIKSVILSLLLFIVVIVADYLLVTYVIEKNMLLDNCTVKLLNGVLIASSVLANYWLIYKKTDSWIYWILYSIAGVCLFVVINNIFSVVLFLFFLFINSTAGIVWIKATPKSNYGWLTRNKNKTI